MLETEMTYIPDREALIQLLAWDVEPLAREAVPGDSEQERAQYRCRVKRTIRRMIEELGDRSETAIEAANREAAPASEYRFTLRSGAGETRTVGVSRDPAAGGGEAVTHDQAVNLARSEATAWIGETGGIVTIYEEREELKWARTLLERARKYLFHPEVTAIQFARPAELVGETINRFLADTEA